MDKETWQNYPRLTRKKLARIKDHALHSLYRMNAGSADCYAFSLTTDGEWRGGWDWSHRLVDNGAQYLLMLNNGEVRKNG